MKTKKSKKIEVYYSQEAFDNKDYKCLTGEELEELQRDKIPECSKEGCEVVNTFLEKSLEEIKKDKIEYLASIGIINKFLDEIEIEKNDPRIVILPIHIIGELTVYKKDNGNK